MYSYKFNKETDEFPTGGTRTNGDTSDGFIIFPDFPIVDWTKQKRVKGRIVDIPITPPDPPYIPTEKEIKRQKLLSLSFEYEPQLLQLDNDAITAKVLLNDEEMFTNIVEEKELLMKEYLTKMEDVKNG